MDSVVSSENECEHIREGGCCFSPGYCAHSCNTPTEPKDSASSSPDEKCRCGHTRKAHADGDGLPAACNACPGDEERSWRHAFTPAEPECLCSSGSPENYEGPARDCPEHGSPEPDAPCACGAPDCMECNPVRCGLEAAPSRPPSRPPYAVAYATGSGTVVELALPGEASAAVEGGALVIRHASGVLGIQHVKPCEGQ